MAITSDFYMSFRCKTSLMAAGTGLILGYFATVLIPPFLSPLYRFATTLAGVTVAVIMNQLVVHSYFYGKMRGAFEYIYRESVLDKNVMSQISKARQPGDEVDLETLHLYNTLLERAKASEKDQKYYGFLAAAKVANVRGEDKNAIAALKSAILLHPLDVIANYKLGRAFERVGSGKEAIEAYEAALRDPAIDSEELRSFIATQARRVKEQGPQQRSPIPGLLYQLM